MADSQDLEIPQGFEHLFPGREKRQGHKRSSILKQLDNGGTTDLLRDERRSSKRVSFARSTLYQELLPDGTTQLVHKQLKAAQLEAENSENNLSSENNQDLANESSGGTKDRSGSDLVMRLRKRKTCGVDSNPTPSVETRIRKPRAKTATAFRNHLQRNYDVNDEKDYDTLFNTSFNRYGREIVPREEKADVTLLFRDLDANMELNKSDDSSETASKNVTKTLSPGKSGMSIDVSDENAAEATKFFDCEAMDMSTVGLANLNDSDETSCLSDCSSEDAVSAWDTTTFLTDAADTSGEELNLEPPLSEPVCDNQAEARCKDLVNDGQTAEATAEMLSSEERDVAVDGSCSVEQPAEILPASTENIEPQESPSSKDRETNEKNSEVSEKADRLAPVGETPQATELSAMGNKVCDADATVEEELDAGSLPLSEDVLSSQEEANDKTKGISGMDIVSSQEVLYGDECTRYTNEDMKLCDDDKSSQCSNISAAVSSQPGCSQLTRDEPSLMPLSSQEPEERQTAVQSKKKYSPNTKLLTRIKIPVAKAPPSAGPVQPTLPPPAPWIVTQAPLPQPMKLELKSVNFLTRKPFLRLSERRFPLQGPKPTISAEKEPEEGGTACQDDSTHQGSPPPQENEETACTEGTGELDGLGTLLSQRTCSDSPSTRSKGMGTCVRKNIGQSIQEKLMKKVLEVEQKHLAQVQNNSVELSSPAGTEKSSIKENNDHVKPADGVPNRDKSFSSSCVSPMEAEDIQDIESTPSKREDSSARRCSSVPAALETSVSTPKRRNESLIPLSVRKAVEDMREEACANIEESWLSDISDTTPSPDFLDSFLHQDRMQRKRSSRGPSSEEDHNVHITQGTTAGYMCTTQLVAYDSSNESATTGPDCCSMEVTSSVAENDGSRKRKSDIILDPSPPKVPKAHLDDTATTSTSEVLCSSYGQVSRFIEASQAGSVNSSESTSLSEDKVGSDEDEDDSSFQETNISLDSTWFSIHDSFIEQGDTLYLMAEELDQALNDISYTNTFVEYDSICHNKTTADFGLTLYNIGSEFLRQNRIGVQEYTESSVVFSFFDGMFSVEIEKAPSSEDGEPRAFKAVKTSLNLDVRLNYNDRFIYLDPEMPFGVTRSQKAIFEPIKCYLKAFLTHLENSFKERYPNVEYLEQLLTDVSNCSKNAKSLLRELAFISNFHNSCIKKNKSTPSETSYDILIELRGIRRNMFLVVPINLLTYPNQPIKPTFGIHPSDRHRYSLKTFRKALDAIAPCERYATELLRASKLFVKAMKDLEAKKRRKARTT